jgi:ribonuclease HI
MDKKNKYYAVARGHKPGIYDQWFGANGAKANIDGFSNAVFKKFSTLEDARSWLKKVTEKNDFTTAGNQSLALTFTPNNQPAKKSSARSKKLDPTVPSKETPCSSSGQVVIYTDGGCIRNPGPGGFGAVLKFKGCRKEISGGYRKTTNNRMELMACIEGLKALKKPCSVVIFSDSKYVVDAIEKGWVTRWRSNGWMRTKTEPAENVDLWEELLKLCNKHKVDFKWVKGHAGNPENERCDLLARQNALKSNLPPDTAYEKGKTKAMMPSEFLRNS